MMTKKQLIHQVATKTGLSQAIISKALASLIEAFKLALVAGDPIKLQDFGSFTASKIFWDVIY